MKTLGCWTVGQETEWAAVAEAVSELLSPTNFNLCLQGDLGAGKTTFTRFLVGLREPQALVQSPTYNLVHQYGIIRHYDLFRIKYAEELEQIGFYDEDQSRIIEWPKFEETWNFPFFKMQIGTPAKGGRKIILTIDY